MNRVFLVLLGLCVAAGIAGCGKSKVIGNGIVLAGHGQVKAMPDVAEISLSIVTRDRTNNRVAATTANAKKSASVRAALAGAGLKPKDVSTESFTAQSIQPYEYEPRYRPKGKPYFEVTNSLLVRTKALKDVGKIVDAAVKAGATSVDSIGYSFDDPAAQQAIALALAVKDAKVRAKAVAEAGGVKLLPISHVQQAEVPQYGGVVACRPARAQGDYRLAKAYTYTSPREETITADVVVTFAVERP
jgi:uncharacterized protein